MKGSKKFIKKLLLFLSVLFVLLSLVQLVYFQTVESHDAFVQQWEKIRGANKVTTVILGDSHVAFGIDQSMLPDSVFNFAYPGDQWTDMYIKSMYILRNKPKIRSFYIQLDEHNFYTGGVNERKDGDPRLYRHVDSKILKSVFNLSFIDLLIKKLKAKFPLLSTRNRLKFEKVLFKNLYAFISNNDWKPEHYYDENGRMHWAYHKEDLSLESKKDYLGLAEAKAFDMHQLDKKMYPKSILAYTMLVDKLYKNDVQSTFFKMPVSQAYLKLRRVNTKNLPDKLKWWPDNVVNIDSIYQDSLFYFADPSHLNGEGQKRFTSYFKHHVLTN